MQSAESGLTHSRFFSPQLNAAIFDGPFRIYFAQHQEGQALRLYFRLQQDFKEGYQAAKRRHRDTGTRLFVIIYPDTQAFRQVFLEFVGDRGLKEEVQTIQWGEDFVIGLNGPNTPDEYSQVFKCLSEIIADWNPLPEVQAPSL